MARLPYLDQDDLAEADREIPSRPMNSENLEGPEDAADLAALVTT